MAGIVTIGMIAALLSSVNARCPMHGDTICADDASESMAIGHKLGRTLKEVPNPAGHPMRILMSAQPTCGDGGYGDLAGYPYPSDPTPPPLTKELYKDIQADLKALLNDSKDFFPADFGGKDGGTYIGLFIRLAWHCAGSYRGSDGRGGCDGGRIRFGPEYEWPDNTNLDKALLLLEPIYDKYSQYISWGDLIILSGNVAISSSGGPILGFCGGRIDDPNGSASLPLGPTSVQQSLAECPADFEGDCPKPLGPAEVGLIYVNPGGPKEAPSDPVASAQQIRTIFARMGFNEREQVALIGGGHTFGKVHGACPDGPGPGPITSPAAPYPGVCKNHPFVEGVTGRGTGLNTFTSGFEGPWTETPTDWDNEYFTNLLAFDWKLEKGPSGAEQWAPYNKQTGERGPDIMMLTSDIAFIRDPVYEKLVQEYASDIESLNRDFAAAWYKLTSQDMGPASRCTGPDVPAPAPFQVPLPEPTVPAGADTTAVEMAITQLLRKHQHAVPLIANLGYQCASTFRTTSWVGGCNGGRIRFEPEISFSTNEGASKAIELLEPIYAHHKDVISFADLIVLASGLALEKAGGPYVPFCPGRVDAENGETERSVAPREYYLDPLVAARDSIDILGLTASEYVALFSRPTKDSPKVSSKVFKDLISNEWEPVLSGDEVTVRCPPVFPVDQRREVDPYTGEYRAKDGSLTIPVTTWVLLKDADLRKWVQEFAMNPEKIYAELGSAWVYLMNADRFDGPTGNVCAGPEYQFEY